MIDTSRRTSRRAPSRTDSVRSRSGSMLLLVLIIFAVGLILITSAMAITVSSRNRYYSASLDSQAGLTANSVAKTIANAIVAGDITDTQLEALTNSGKTVDITAATAATAAAGSAAGSNAIAPGLAGTSGSNTKATFSYYPDAATKTYILITVKTQLATASDNQSQTVSVLLKKKPVIPNTQFGSLITVGGGSTNDLMQMYVGANALGTNTTNYVVAHGSVMAASGGGQYFYSDMLFTDQLAASAGTTFYGNLIFYGNNASISTVTAGNGVHTVGGNILFLGDNASAASVFTDSSNNPTSVSGALGAGVYAEAKSGVGGGIYFKNNTLLSSANTDSAIKASVAMVVDNSSVVNFTHNYYTPSTAILRASASSTATYVPATTTTSYPYTAANESAAIVVTLRDLALKYSSSKVAAAVNRTIPSTTAAAFTEIGIAQQTGAQIVANASAVQISGSDLTTIGTKTFTGSAYYIDTSLPSTVSPTSGSEWMGSVTLNFDCTSTDITLYVIGGGTLQTGQGLIEFTRSSGTHIGRIILLDGSDILLNQNNYNTRNDTGIIGSYHTATGVGTCTTYVSFTTDGSGNVTNTYPPFLYIYGTGNNTVNACQYSTLEGFIGLYGPSGTVTLSNQPYFYGRLEATYVTYGGGTPAKVPYCPAPGDGSSGGTGSPSSYEIKGYINS